MGWSGGGKRGKEGERREGGREGRREVRVCEELLYMCMQVRSQGGFRVAQKPHTWHGSLLAAREPPNLQHVKYAHALDPRGYISI